MYADDFEDYFEDSYCGPRRYLVDEATAEQNSPLIEFSRRNSTPYCIEVENNTSKEKNVVIFGYNMFSSKPNYGNEKGIKIKNLVHESDYHHLLFQSGVKPFKIGLTSITTNKGNIGNIILTVVHFDANGCRYSSPKHLFLDAYQQQSNIVQTHKQITVDGNTYFIITVPPKTKYQLFMYPTSVVSMGSILNSIIPKAARIPRAFAKPFKLTRWMKIKWFFRNVLSSSHTTSRKESYLMSA